MAIGGNGPKGALTVRLALSEAGPFTDQGVAHFRGSTTVFVDPSGAACIPGGL